jgi:hypothetical protein
MMTRVAHHAALAVVLLLAVAGCSNDGTTTGPGGSSGGSLSAGVGITILNPDFASTLGRAQLFWDGKMVDDQSATPPVGAFLLGAVVTTSPGAHTLSFKIISQTASPITYTITGGAEVTDIQTGASQEVSISGNPSVATGVTVSYSVTLH